MLCCCTLGVRLATLSDTFTAGSYKIYTIPVRLQGSCVFIRLCELVSSVFIRSSICEDVSVIQNSSATPTLTHTVFIGRRPCDRITIGGAIARHETRPDKNPICDQPAAARQNGIFSEPPNPALTPPEREVTVRADRKTVFVRADEISF